jgi:anti-repressor protein
MNKNLRKGELTMNQLQSFMYESHQVRTVFMDDQPWFVAKDVCDVLDISKYRDAVSRLDQDERESVIVDTLGGKQEMTAINESGLYSLIMTSRKPEAKQFKRWITHEVIPSIRKHGAYMTPETLEQTMQDPDFLIGILNGLKKEQEARKKLEQKVIEDRPKVFFAEALQISEDSILVADLAKLLRQKGFEVGEHRLFRMLREDGYLIKSGSEYNMPTQKSMELGLFEIKIGHRGSSDGTIKITRTPKVTGKGQAYFINKYLKPAS